MSARSALTVVSGTTITSAWGNNIRDHAVTRTTTNDVSADGQLVMNTSTGQLVAHDGAGATRIAHYKESGRIKFSTTGFSHVRRAGTTFYTAGEATVTNGVACTVVWQSDATANPGSGWITDGWAGFAGVSNELVTVPYDGLYSGFIRIGFVSSWAFASDLLSVTVGSADARLTPIFQGGGYCSWSRVPMDAGESVSHAIYQFSGSTQTVDSVELWLIYDGV